jgi:hypothetical protein
LNRQIALGRGESTGKPPVSEVIYN